MRYRSWATAWTEVECPSCGHHGQWPQPEFDCACGVTVRLAAGAAGAAGPTAAPERGERLERVERPPFQPLTIRTSYDAVACAAQFLRWLGFIGVRGLVPRPATGIDLRGPTMLGLVNATTMPARSREVETLWLHAALESASAVAFALAGFDRGSRCQADGLGLPLFVLDLTGRPQPVNEPAEALLRRGAGDAEA
ncbi:hypothetical protein [Streptomyces sp. PT12]|uniref:hypothetical protein n=1 Tax=Streptomyces sp. PT12 TaxID=1510197 RepID=UPI002852A39D|nr:hypothetical protein [Streptomyces sp. PT12]